MSTVRPRDRGVAYLRSEIEQYGPRARDAPAYCGKVASWESSREPVRLGAGPWKIGMWSGILSTETSRDGQISAKYALLPDADEGDALLRAPGDDSDGQGEGEGEDDGDGAGAGSAAGRERGEGSDTFPPPVELRFEQTPPAAWKRAGLLVLIFFCFWLAFQIKGHRAPPNVVHASRYSKEFKYRPAASPIVTETLKDGRVRVRGAAPTSSATPAPKPTAAKPKTGKRKGGKGKKNRVAAKK
ncbi:hypothetical protein B0H14DRAFT_3141210 [Mycena olivaceomarginata]|nr:hypothetical protein B0H14DRAFT_3141210 [Mycena olivaceomarginata]